MERSGCNWIAFVKESRLPDHSWPILKWLAAYPELTMVTWGRLLVQGVWRRSRSAVGLWQLFAYQRAYGLMAPGRAGS